MIETNIKIKVSTDLLSYIYIHFLSYTIQIAISAFLAGSFGQTEHSSI